MKHIHYYIVLCLAILCMAACSSSRKVAVEKASVSSLWKDGESVVARSGVTLSDGRSKTIKLNGTLRMRRNDVIQLNVTYILGIQVGTMELTRDSVLLLSRATRQYVVMSYPELSAIIGRTVTFDDMQNIFWGEAKDFAVRGVDWKYGSMSAMEDGRTLPGELSMSFSNASSKVAVSLKLSKHAYNDAWARRTSVKSSYERLSPEQAMRLIMMLMGTL